MSDIPFAPNLPSAVLDSAHEGDIRGALGTIHRGHPHAAARSRLGARLRTLAAILGPGLIVMVGDNDAGAFSTYSQAGQNFGVHLLWTLPLLIPVLYVNQEMVLRLGAVTGVGHARLIFARFGRFWGAFSVIDLFLLNALTIVTEFIGITLALDYLGVPRLAGLAAAAALVIAAAGTGSFRRFERFALALCAGSLLLVPVFIWVHPPLGQIGINLLVPSLPHHAALSDVMLLIIGIVGTTIAPWQLFFQQSYVIDKRITPRFIPYEKIDLWIGIVVVLVGAIAIMAAAAAAFGGTAAFGQFTDAGSVARGLAAKGGHLAGILFAIALLDASIIGAAAVSLATAYAIGDVLSLKHSLHRKATDARGFYAVYAGLILAAGLIVVFGNASLLGLLTNAVQTLAGVLLPSATVFLLLLCNDPEVLGPWVNGRLTNLFTGAVIWLLVLLSLILTAATLFPSLSGRLMVEILAVGSLVGLVALAVPRARAGARPAQSGRDRATWRMPRLESLAPLTLSRGQRAWMGVLRLYLAGAMVMVIVKVANLALGH